MSKDKFSDCRQILMPEEVMMSFKTFLKILLGVALFAFAIIALKWKTGERDVQVAYTQSSRVKTDIVETNTQRMMNVNAQASGLMAGAEQSTAQTSLVPVRSSGSDDDGVNLFVTGTYRVKTGRYFAAADRDVYNQLVKLSAQTDTRKYEKYLNKGLDNGSIIFLDQGQSVVLNEVSSDQKTIQVSLFGESKAWWTGVSCIK